MAKGRGLTLIEVMAVVALMGVAAAATAWSMAGDVKRAGGEAVIERIGNADRMARIAAVRLEGRSVLRIDMDRQRMERVRIDEDERLTRTVVVKCGGDVRMTGVMRAGMVWNGGEVEIGYSSGGRSESYAVRVSLGKDEQQVWLVFAGLTGQMVRVNDEKEVEKIFENLAAGWNDAD